MSSLKLSDIEKIPEGKVLDKFEELYTLWANIPVLVQLEEDGAKLQHPVLTAILKVLRTGVRDDNGKIRYFLTVNELLDELPILLKNLIDKPVKKSMLYYYLDILQSMNLIIHVYYIDGRHKRKYFGRTGKFFIFGDEEQAKEKKSAFFASFIKYLTIKNSEISEETIIALVEEVMEIIKNEGQKIVDLIHRDEKILLNYDIDAKDLYESFWYFVPFLIDQKQAKSLIDIVNTALNE